MFDNVGNKIKILAKAYTTIGIIASIIWGIYLMAELPRSRGVILGLLIIISGALISYISSLILYGFGELVENAENSNWVLLDINKKLGNTHSSGSKIINNTPNTAPKPNFWTCKKCKTVNEKYSGFCKDCGASK